MPQSQKEAYDGRIDPTRSSRITWPNQQRPPSQGWILWKEAIDNVWCRTGSRRLHDPLGAWIEPSHQTFQWLYNRTEHALYHQDGYRIMKCIPSQIRTRRQRIFRSIGQVDTVPDECEYATILRYRGNEVIFEGSSPMLPKEQQHHFTSFQQYISLLPQGPRKILEHSIFYDNAEQIAIALQNRVALAVTDASYEIDTNIGAAAWTIVGAQNNVYCEGRIGQPSLATETDPYRAETLGILAILTATEHICKYHKVTQGKITVACDNDARLENSIDRSTRMKTKKITLTCFGPCRR